MCPCRVNNRLTFGSHCFVSPLDGVSGSRLQLFLSGSTAPPTMGSPTALSQCPFHAHLSGPVMSLQNVPLHSQQQACLWIPLLCEPLWRRQWQQAPIFFQWLRYTTNNELSYRTITLPVPCTSFWPSRGPTKSRTGLPPHPIVWSAPAAAPVAAGPYLLPVVAIHCRQQAPLQHCHSAYFMHLFLGQMGSCKACQYGGQPVVDTVALAHVHCGSTVYKNS